MAKKISDRVSWVGKIDWELKHFHGNELSTFKGSSYNAYLVRGSEKTVLIDTVWGPYDREFVSRLKEEINLNEIDAIIMNHNENDHSGALPELLREIPNTPIYCTENGRKILNGLYHQDFNIITVKTGDTLSLGKETLTFIEAPMIHWPDTMFTYMDTENILFSNDGFGQHFATENMFTDSCDMDEVMYEAMKYYTNIINPFSMIVKAKLNAIMKMNLPISMIAPSHGALWRENIDMIINKYFEWADQYQENQISIIYDTMWQSTRLMAENICDGIKKIDDSITVKLINIPDNDKNDIMTEIFKSKAVLFGCPTINNGLSYGMDGILGMAKGLKFKNKKAAAFGSYGWSGEGVKLMTEYAKSAGFEILHDGIKLNWAPDYDSLLKCRAFGEEFAKVI
ncbi:MAG: MBL fold metallo-hydrolase [Candidatus Fimenecus sp.]